LKTSGNRAYQSREFENAIDYYTKAIAAFPLAVFYSNRAACYSNLNRPEDVIPDCNRALSMDRTYVKALNRRAVAREQIGGDGEGEGEDGDKKRQLLFESLAGE
jgi:import receptor subunit TOM70